MKLADIQCGPGVIQGPYLVDCKSDFNLTQRYLDSNGINASLQRQEDPDALRKYLEAQPDRSIGLLLVDSMLGARMASARSTTVADRAAMRYEEYAGVDFILENYPLIQRKVVLTVLYTKKGEVSVRRHCAQLRQDLPCPYVSKYRPEDLVRLIRQRFGATR